MAFPGIGPRRVFGLVHNLLNQTMTRLAHCRRRACGIFNSNTFNNPGFRNLTNPR
jgi:hypothetical protein